MPHPPLVAPAATLSPDELERYSRQIRMPQLGPDGQRRLKAARVLVLGAGGLGSPVLLYLAASGVGCIGIVDDDTIEVSNLQRQTIHRASGVGTSKARSARASIAELNPHVRVELHEVRLTAANAAALFSKYDLVVDGTDNFATRYLADETAAAAGIPCVWGSVLRFDGQASVFWSAAPEGPVLLRDLFPVAPADDEAESCSVAGVLGPLCATIGAAMATEAIKLICGFGEPLIGRVLVVDALDGSHTVVPFRGSGSVADAARAGARETPAAHPEAPRRTPSITAAALKQRLDARAAGADDFVLVDVREPWEYEFVAIDGAVLVPLGSVLSDGARASLPMDAPIIVHCHHDTRSQHAREALLQAGYTDVTFVEGGITAWSLTVDPDAPLY